MVVETCKSLLMVIVALLIVVASAGFSYADGYVHPLEYQTPRTRAMGGASVAVADDHQAFFTNPAGLGQRTSKAYSVINLSAAMNTDYRKVRSRLESLGDDDTPGSRLANNNLLAEAMGKRMVGEVSNFAYYMGGAGFGAAFLYQASMEASVVRPANPRIRVRGDSDSVLAGSYAWPLSNETVMFRDRARGWLGTTMKFVSRRTIDSEFDARDYAALSKQDLEDNQFAGVAMDLDFGALWILSSPWYPSVGLQVANILESKIDRRVGRLRRHATVGTALRPLTGPPERNRKLLLAADIVDVTSSDSLFKKLRLGSEVELRDWLHIQMGLMSGYFTAGFSANFKDARVDFASYGVELGSRAGDLEDRRLSLSFLYQF